MKRLQEFILAATPGRKPWEGFLEEAIAQVAALCGPADLAEIIAELEALAEEKAKLPAWDGDAQDDVGKAQELFAKILAAAPAALLPAVADGLKSSDEQTRRWVAIALEMRRKS